VASSDRPEPKGRGSHLNPPNRFTQSIYEEGPEHRDGEDREPLPNPRTQYVPDHARSIVAENSSPDIPFRYSRARSPSRG